MKEKEFNTYVKTYYIKQLVCSLHVHTCITFQLHTL